MDFDMVFWKRRMRTLRNMILKRVVFCVEAQRKIEVFYDGIRVGECFADFVVNDLIIFD